MRRTLSVSTDQLGSDPQTVSTRHRCIELLPEHCENISFTVLYIITTTHYSYTHSIYNSEDDDEDMMILLPITCNTNYNIISRKIVNILVFWFKMPLSLSVSCLLPFNQLYSTV